MEPSRIVCKRQSNVRIIRSTKLDWNELVEYDVDCLLHVKTRETSETRGRKTLVLQYDFNKILCLWKLHRC